MSAHPAIPWVTVHSRSTSALGAQIQLLMALAVPAGHYAFGVFAAESAETVAQA